MAETSTPPEPKTHWVTIQFSEKDDHYLLSSSFKSGPNNMFIDGKVADERLKQYLSLLFAEAEDYRRGLRT